jgi:uncharacterized Zn finger protein (UPF0148 family)
MTTPLDVIEKTRVAVTLITGDPAPTCCPRCQSPRFMIDGPIVAFQCHTRAQFFKQLPGEHRNPKVKQTLKCIALAKAGGWKRAAA